MGDYSADAAAQKQLAAARRGDALAAAVRDVPGGIALATAFAAVHPLDTLKTRLQAAAGQTSSGHAASRAIMSRTLLHGFSASVLGAAPQGGARLATYELTKQLLTSQSSKSTLPHLAHSPLAASALAAICGDLASSVVKVPREVVTARLQTASTSPSAATPSAAAVCRYILATEGPAGFFRGFWSTTGRDVPFMVILFTSYETLKAYEHREMEKAEARDDNHHQHTIPTLNSTLYGGFSGALAGLITTPFDVVKTRIMTAGSAGRQSIRSVARSLIQSQRAAGKSAIPVFFTGALARSTWWFCVCSIFFPTYEGVKARLKT